MHQYQDLLFRRYPVINKWMDKWINAKWSSSNWMFWGITVLSSFHQFCFLNNTPKVCAEDHHDPNLKWYQKLAFTSILKSWDIAKVWLRIVSRWNKMLCFYCVAGVFSLHPSAQLFSSVDSEVVVPRKIYFYQFKGIIA